MRLRKISVRNFRNLREIDICPRKTSVILGENNAGKSNLLHALRLLFDSQAERLRLDLSEEDINDAARLMGEKWFSITVEVGDLQKHVDVEACFKERIDLDGTETFITIEGRYEPDSEGIYGWRTFVMPPHGRFNEPLAMTPRMFRAVPLYFMDAIRDASRDARAAGRGLFAQLLEEIDYTDVQADVKGHLKDANVALNRGKDISALAGGLTREMTPHVPGGQTEVLIAVADEDVGHLTRSLHLHLRKTPSADYSDISRQGTGLQNLALMAMFRHKVASEKKGVPILAIEEPEAHLHPHAQRRLFKDLDAIDAPVLVSTHSPSIVKYADPSNLILLRTTQVDETKAFQLDPRKIDSADLRGLSQLMRGGRADMFFARAIIIAEGISELTALPAFAEVLGCDLDRDGISLVEASGNHYSFILRACQQDQFAIPSVITYDTDVLAENNELLKEAYKVGLIDQATRDSCAPNQADIWIKRKAVLDILNWFGAVQNFEEEACKAGYLNAALKAIDDLDPVNHSHSKALDAHLKKTGHTLNASSVAEFVHKRENLKVPIAREIAETALAVRQVPDCYSRAIRRAILEATGGIVVDKYFETRACSAGMLNIIIGTIKAEGAADQIQQFLGANRLQEDAHGVTEFMLTSDVGKQMRDKVRYAIADAVDSVGCKQYSDQIRNAQPLVVNP
jgi:putative ATP-dependent endonuclease of the OLD family